ncbi:endonuclease/exonuclease/phosphatase family protein [Fulvivirgaceae bacterium BMA10]|uniref:Endonuclease/exonuclease/phosphatase family protein n=1 Tax=Splendidivirga corallicola TaxID=3051826 RepID=A0ABT8KJX3_9BACT|nr:endonuclease/exonuclease/phosphatase family protein [Fulvivirgaceae bacterium BMA10]
MTLARLPLQLSFFFIPLFLMVSFSPRKPDQQTPDPEGSLKVMTYNIWNGFDWGKDLERRDKVVAWIRNIDPDVLALQELCGYNEEKLKKEALKWGHPYTVILKSDGYPVGLTSKKPITVKERALEGLWHGMLHCETFGVDFFVVHLSPADCDFRLKEANIITNKIKDSNANDYIILGDFNAHSPFDGDMLKQNKSLLAKYSKRKPDDKYSNLRLGEFDYSVISTFQGLPAIDICQKFINPADRYSFPTPALIGTYRTAESVGKTRERIDYILASPEVAKAAVRAQIFNGEVTSLFSDHYPVMAEFFFK